MQNFSSISLKLCLLGKKTHWDMRCECSLSLQYIFMDCESMLSCVTLTLLFCFLALWFEKVGDRNMILIMSGQKLPAGTLK